jgi:hypothetical protein
MYTLNVIVKSEEYWQHQYSMSQLHDFNDKNICEEGKLCKVSPLLDHVSTVFKTLYIPTQKLGTDKVKLKCQGHRCFQVNNPGRLKKHGIMI